MAIKKKNRIEFEIGYSVDKKGIPELQSLLQQISNRAAEPGKKITAGLQESAKAARVLDGILDKTFNTDLGTLNVSKFNKELAKSGYTLKTLQAQLSKTNDGGTAFNRLSSAILNTNVQLKKSNALLDDMANTMANTVRWGITSTIFNNITSSIGKAVNYVEKLDKSLNSIRIVSGATAEEMNKFAIAANNASKSLGASTLDYTEAALIYYQQGLNAQEAAARTDITVKMANVLGTSAEEVSNHMTAIWNNFDDGSKSLEHFSDVITALGAKTAASSEEIATGLEKFASVAEASGLSYEYATSALATVVATTRQSAETVGTALILRA